MKRFNLSRSEARFVLYQRTAYLRFQKSPFWRRVRKILEFLTYERMVTLEALVSVGHISRLYASDMSKEYRTFNEHLPPAVKNVLDIGCGIAGIDVFLNQHYTGSPIFHLFDKTAIQDRIFYAFHERGAFYNSLDLAERFLTRNGIDPDRIRLLEANEHNRIPGSDRFDLVISLLSWGFHYPVETYLSEVHERMNQGGVLICDIRRDTGGDTEIASRFGAIRVLHEHPKFIRVKAVR